MLGKNEGGEGASRGWDVWISSMTQWTWVWVNFRSWWWTGRPGVLESMRLQRVGHNWVTELNWNVSTFTSNSVLFLWYFFFFCLFKEPTYFSVSWRGYIKDKTYGLVKSHSEALLFRVLKLLFPSPPTEINNARFNEFFGINILGTIQHSFIVFKESGYC